MTTSVAHYVVVTLVVFFINVLPAFAPPTWIVLVLFKLNWHLHPAALVVLGAVAAASGRYCLATGTGALRSRLSPHRVESLKALKSYLTGHRGRSALGLALFTLSPLPSSCASTNTGATQPNINAAPQATAANRKERRSTLVS